VAVGESDRFRGSWLGGLGGWRGEGFGRVYGRGAGSFQLDGWGEGGVGGESDGLEYAGVERWAH